MNVRRFSKNRGIPFQEFLDAWRSAGYLLMVIQPES